MTTNPSTNLTHASKSVITIVVVAMRTFSNAPETVSREILSLVKK